MIDIQSLLLNVIILALILGPAGLLSDFFRSFKLAFQGRIDISEEQLNRALASQKYAIRALLLTGPISMLVQFIIILHIMTDPSSLGPNVAVAVLTLLYGLAFSMIFSFVELKIRTSYGI